MNLRQKENIGVHEVFEKGTDSTPIAVGTAPAGIGEFFSCYFLTLDFLTTRSVFKMVVTGP